MHERSASPPGNCPDAGAGVEIKDFLSAADVLVDARANDKADLLEQLATHAAASLDLAGDLIFAELMKREDLGSTGTGGGIALPHARLEQVKKPFGMLARLAHSIEFDAIDGRKVDLVFLLLLPAETRKGQRNALACVARRLREAKVLDGLRRAKAAGDLYAAVLG
jgi:PTS system nitrogen regulatory IIA component